MNINKKTIAVVANGRIDDPGVIKTRIQSFEFIVAVNGGLAQCDKMGITPHLLVGDQDSLSIDLQKKYSHLQTLKFPAEKDETDLELALREICKPGVLCVTLFGAWGDRVDHSLYNLNLLRRYPKQLSIETEIETLFVIDQASKIPCQKGQTLSLIPLGGEVKGITTKGLRWELCDARFDKNFMSISNICLKNPVEVNLSSGELLCILQKINAQDE